MKKREMIMQFGEYTGKSFEDIPLEYLLNLYEHQKLSKALEKFLEKAILILKYAREIREERLRKK